MKRTWLAGLLILTVVLTLCTTAMAHSTKGRMKIDLDLERPSLDDFAFFMESYVYKELYRHQEAQWENRFYVKEFTGLELKDNQAVVRFVRLDTKTKKDVDDRMTFERGQDGVWSFTPLKGERVKVYTYVQKGGYYYKKYILPLSIAGIVLTIGGCGLLYVVRRRKTVCAGDKAQAGTVLRAGDNAATPATGEASPPEQVK